MAEIYAECMVRRDNTAWNIFCGIEMVKHFCNIHTEKIIDWNISFQTVSCIHLMNVDVYDCNSHIHNPTCFPLTLDLFQTDSVV